MVTCQTKYVTREPLLKESLSTIDHLVLISFNQLLLKMQILFTFYQTSYLNEELNHTEPYPLQLVFPGVTSHLVLKNKKVDSIFKGSSY